MRMLPSSSNTEVIGDDEAVMPNKTYYLDMERKRIRGNTSDALTAVRQAVYKILRTERYDYLVYGRSYGIELKELFGREKNYVLPMLAKNISEALLADDRIVNVKDFSFAVKGRGVYNVSFTVVSKYGDFEEEVDLSVWKYDV
jgi:hypothetical protein